MISPEILQPIFDRVATHFLSMPKPSASEDGVICLYRDPDNGNRCFIGALIQDEDYRPEIEGVSVRSKGYKPFGAGATLEVAIVRGMNALGIEIDELNDDLRDSFDRLQVIHDQWGEGRCGREDVKQHLIEFAEARKLSTAALTAEVTA
jgi:hypothetical protein